MKNCGLEIAFNKDMKSTTAIGPIFRKPRTGKSTGRLTLLMLAAVLTGCTPKHTTGMNRLESDSDIAGPTYQQMLDKADAAAKVSPDVTVLSYGQSLKGLPLKAIRIAKAGIAGVGTKPPAILISEATHGNEFLDLGYRLMDWMATDRTSPGLSNFLTKGGAIYIVLVLNPDGYEYHRTLTPQQRQADGGPDSGNSWGRMNGNRIDLNRDFPMPLANQAGVTQPETKLLVDFVRSEITSKYKLEFSMDYHCCIGEGALLLPWAYSETAVMDAADQERYKGPAALFARQLTGIRVGRAFDIAGYAAVGTTKDYYFNEYKSVSFTFEGKYLEEGKRLEAHRLFWDSLMADIANRYPGGSSSVPTGTINSAQGTKVFLAKEDTNGMAFIVAADSGTAARMCAGGSAACLSAAPPQSIAIGLLKESQGRKFFAESGFVSRLPIPADRIFTVIVTGGSTPNISYSFRVQSK